MTEGTVNGNYQLKLLPGNISSEGPAGTHRPSSPSSSAISAQFRVGGNCVDSSRIGVGVVVVVVVVLHRSVSSGVSRSDWEALRPQCVHMWSGVLGM